MGAGQDYSTLQVPVGSRDHTVGSKTAPITLVEYGDYECPYCGQAYWVVKAILRDLNKSLLFAFRNFPLSQIHPHAYAAAAAAEAAGKQKRFWPMHDMLFEHQEALTYQDLLAYSRSLRLDVPKFVADLESNWVERRIRKDFLSGLTSGVNGTPTFFINGRRHDGGYDYDSLSVALATAIQRKQERGGDE